MSKWFDQNEYEKFKGQKENEPDADSGNSFKGGIIWPNPKAGSNGKPNIYKVRFLPNVGTGFYKWYYMHYIPSTVKQRGYYIFCPKTDGMDNFCPICAISSQLYSSGSKDDKAFASQINKSIKYVSNIFVVKDVMDEERDEEYKCEGKVKLYTFPMKVEAKLKAQIKPPKDMDPEDVVGGAIFDPGKDGYDFILKVQMTKKDKNGNDYVNYDDSEFARKSRKLGTDAEIEKIMEDRKDVDEFIDSKRNEYSQEDILNILKEEQLDGFITTELQRFGWVIKEEPEDKKEEIKAEEKSSDEEQETSRKEPETVAEGDDEISAEDKKLLDEIATL